MSDPDWRGVKVNTEEINLKKLGSCSCPQPRRQCRDGRDLDLLGNCQGEGELPETKLHGRLSRRRRKAHPGLSCSGGWWW